MNHYVCLKHNIVYQLYLNQKKIEIKLLVTKGERERGRDKIRSVRLRDTENKVVDISGEREGGRGKIG